ncbi:MAG: class I SAM-dependent methyltransferase [Cohaesibacteraceae bacterium]|nr:class I SAM-dependent methyltransferase [Cohaesibacteraceae bacterium]MBL4874943.1 class I SAM-dependent methyltransferase [Cohaesibacteraceae bacterium]
MTNDDTDKTLAVYDGMAKKYAQESSERRTNNNLNHFLDQLPVGGHMLDLGSGSGWASKHALHRNFRVTACDGSTGLAAEAEKLTGLKVDIRLYEQIEYSENMFDGVWACASLLHCPKSEFHSLLARVGTSIKPGGQIWASFKQGDTESCDKLGRFYAYYQPDELLEIFQGTGMFENIIIRRIFRDDYLGTPTGFLELSATKSP